uniref:AB hydrolase-1 domain-containing protein n=1 Tax=Strongyloides stercoralis TaxID=6248 RepID=A0AAF5I2E9_STRER
LGIIYLLATIFTIFSLINLIKEYIFNGYNIFVKNLPQRPKCLDNYKSNFLYLNNNIKLHYVMEGEKGKELICVAIDMRGYGESDKPNGIGEYKIEKLIEDVENVIHKLGYKKAIIVGHDWGSIVSWMFAAFYPEMVTKLIIMDVPHPNAAMITYRRYWKQIVKSAYIYLFQFPIVPELIMRKKGGIYNKNQISNEDISAYIYTFVNGFTGPINFYRAFLQRWNLIEMPKEPIKPETLIIFGEKDYFVISENAQLSQNYCSKSDIAIIKNGSHWIQQDFPDENFKIDHR